MLLTFSYHRINSDKYSNSYKIIEDHLTYIAKKYRVVLPKDKLNPFKLNICLSFDDAFYDFYKYVYPLLKKLQIKAILAIPIKYILESTSVDDEIRLNVPYKDAMKKNIYKTQAPFCTWQEIKEMVDSNLVEIASHSYNHINLIDSKNLDLEIIKSKEILEKKLKTEITTFVYPMGKFNEEIHKKVKKHYKYAMRLGSAINFSWQNISSITYRIMSDNLKTKNENLKLKNYISYFWFFFLNTFRRR
ncbi:MAG: Poly-beta-1,6-N-acetyl-D-glucosamine N-deacetylase [Candidatus Anoxychlamydiales bacterium]|uniref:NodB homology domain-containing protein n=1 Tax=marine sediment metagenome TaxID=412755 RepID=A0A0F9ERL8_9ZZZZ|nr:Poly-beta-1,6-N-acetyl-D-glucosamine N-deacetylase [Candidatus Anoxychlamydiales bacterium]HEU64066.1 polysaccharide deacetylase family protein [Chlamydiota bacterium]